MRGFTEWAAQLWTADGGAWVKELLRKSGTNRWDPHIDWHQADAPLSGDKIAELMRLWQRFRFDMLAWMQDFDVLVCPVNARASWPSEFDSDDWDGDLRAFSYTFSYNLTGWPGAVVRCGTGDDGMPIGVQIVSRPWREDVCLAVAKQLETALGGWQNPRLS